MWTLLGGKKNILKFCLFWYNVGYIYQKLNNMKTTTRLKKLAEYVEIYMGEPARVLNETQLQVCCNTWMRARSIAEYLNKYGETSVDDGDDYSNVTLTIKKK
jgi:hypothetical protein